MATQTELQIQLGYLNFLIRYIRLHTAQVQIRLHSTPQKDLNSHKLQQQLSLHVPAARGLGLGFVDGPMIQPDPFSPNHVSSYVLTWSLPFIYFVPSSSILDIR